MTCQVDITHRLESYADIEPECDTPGIRLSWYDRLWGDIGHIVISQNKNNRADNIAYHIGPHFFYFLVPHLTFFEKEELFLST